MDILANRVSNLLTDNIRTYVGSLVSVGDLKIRNVTCDMVPGRPLSNSTDQGVTTDSLIGAGVPS